MQDFPHRYSARASAGMGGDVTLEADRLPELKSAPPAEFDGPGNRWSPETLLMAAVADCLVLTFRAVARASKLEWMSLGCDVEGVLDRLDGVPQFIEISIRASLTVSASGNAERAERLLRKAEASCLITNSLKASVHLETTVDVPE